MIHFELIYTHSIREGISFVLGHVRHPAVAAPRFEKNSSFGIFVENQLIRHIWFISGLSIPTTRLLHMFFLLPEKLFSIRTLINSYSPSHLSS